MVGAWDRGGVQQAAADQQQQLSGAQQGAFTSAGHALNLFRAYVAAGLWAKLTVEQRQDGEHLTLLYRPMAAAATTTAAAAKGRRKRKRKPNLRRRERQKQKKKLSRSSKGDMTGQQQQQQQRQQADQPQQ